MSPLILMMGSAGMLVVGYAIWLYFKERHQGRCPDCGVILTEDNTCSPNAGTDLCINCYVKEVAPEYYNTLRVIK